MRLISRSHITLLTTSCHLTCSSYLISHCWLMINVGSFCDLQSLTSASHTDQIAAIERSEKAKKEKNNSRFCCFFCYVWWHTTKELRKSLIIYFALRGLSVDDRSPAEFREIFPGKLRRPKRASMRRPASVVVAKLYFFHPNKKTFYSHNFHHTPKLDSHFHILFSLLLSLELTMSRCKRCEWFFLKKYFLSLIN